MAAERDRLLMDFDKALELYEPVLGFEVHVELDTKTKMFSAAPNPAARRHAPRRTPSSRRSTSGCPARCPSSTRQAVRYSISLGLALGCSIAPSSRFARKNYFYPDLGKNYQICQYDEPIAFEGSVEVELEDGTHRDGADRARAHGGGRRQAHPRRRRDRPHPGRRVLARRLQPRRACRWSRSSRSRSTAPSTARPRSPRRTSRRSATSSARLGISEARMERGNLRCDANVSLRPRGQEKLGTRTETKNVNSLRSVERAVRYEIQRQAAILADGGTITQETRHWHEDTGTTSPGRPKSDADDYRYFPEPDLLPVEPSRRADRGAARRAARVAGGRSVAACRRTGASPTSEFQDVAERRTARRDRGDGRGGRRPGRRRASGGLGEIPRIANAAGRRGRRRSCRPLHVAELHRARRERDAHRPARPPGARGRHRGGGHARRRSSTARGLAVVSDDGALIAAIDDGARGAARRAGRRSATARCRPPARSSARS